MSSSELGRSMLPQAPRASSFVTSTFLTIISDFTALSASNSRGGPVRPPGPVTGLPVRSLQWIEVVAEFSASCIRKPLEV